MSNIHQLNNDIEELRLDAASDWIAKIDRQLSDDEKASLQMWLAVSPKNAEVLFEVAKLWDKMDDLSRLSDLFPNNVGTRNKLPAWASAMAASVIFAITVGLYQGGFTFFGQGKQEPSALVSMQMNYQTQTGESNTFNLPDNSKIVLNTNSFVQVKYTDKARIIELQRGEIHIDVAHDNTRPLSVIAGGKVIQAVGTAFNVEVRQKLVELIVTDGKVLVGQNKRSSGENNIETIDIDALAKKLPKNSMAISKGEKVDLDLTGKQPEKVIKVDAIDVAASLSWRQGNLIFRGESLAYAMEEISRYTDIEFELTNETELANIQVAGMFKTGDVTGLLDVLSRNFNIQYERVSPDKITLTYAGT